MNRYFRPLINTDLELVVSVESSATQLPWNLAQFSDSALHDCFTVICLDDQLVGFAIFQQVLDDVSLLNIAIEPSHQGQGHAKALLIHQLKQLVLQGARQCFLEVRVSNYNAIGLYKSLGFIVVGERKNYYPATHNGEKNTRENALVMRLSLENYTEDKS